MSCLVGSVYEKPVFSFLLVVKKKKNEINKRENSEGVTRVK